MGIFSRVWPFLGQQQKAAVSPSREGRGWHTIYESFAGAWQQDVKVTRDLVLSHHADFACRTLIASDVAKLRLMLVRKSSDGIWTEFDAPESRVLVQPNGFQTRIQFYESWLLSKLQSGNTYVLLQRDERLRVSAMYVLDPARVTVLVSDEGEVYYRLQDDNLSGLATGITVPARDIIHDRFNTFFHPLVGLSPIYANGLAATQALSIQNDSTKFFQNGARPGGILTAPGAIAKETAERLKTYWDENFSGENSGKVAVVGDGLKYEPMRSKAVDSQVIEQLKWTAEVVCGVYHVPAFLAGVGPEPSYNNVQNLTLRYYSQCLQRHIEDIEACLDRALGFDGSTVGTEFDSDDLMRMDTLTQYEVAQKAKGILTLDEQRRRLNLPKVQGGSTIYLQQQDHSLEAIAARDAQLIEGERAAPEPDNDRDEIEAAIALREIMKGLSA